MGQILKAPAQVRGETMRTLVEAIVRERSVSDEKLRCLRWSFKMLGIGLALVALEGATLAFVKVHP